MACKRLSFEMENGVILSKISGNEINHRKNGAMMKRKYMGNKILGEKILEKKGCGFKKGCGRGRSTGIFFTWPILVHGAQY